MFAALRYIADPTIPGLSRRDIADRAVDSVASAANDSDGSARHRDFVIRHDLGRLDRQTLRDLGLDRDQAA
jgi:hypothetical protein